MTNDSKSDFESSKNKIAVVIPCFKVGESVLNLLKQIGNDVHLIFVVDDCCPHKTGDIVAAKSLDKRINIIRHPKNLGVGGAMISGYRAAIDSGCDVIVKMDGDGQMDPRLIHKFIAPIVNCEADYTKGNRFYDLESVRAMPKVRLFGNAILSFVTKFSSGYYNLFDPNNGYIAISSHVARMLNFDKISRRFFFESDMLFRLYIIRAVIVEIPMSSVYSDEISNLKIRKILLPFMKGHLLNCMKRILYSHFLRGFSIASVELVLGVMLLIFGFCFGIHTWSQSADAQVLASSGTVMLSALPLIIGTQFIISFLHYDLACMPNKSLSSIFKPR